MPSKLTLRVAVLISGNGSNLQAIIDDVDRRNNAAQSALAEKNTTEISVVLSNRPDAYGLQRAANAHIPVEVLDHKDYANRAQYDQALLATLEKYQPGLIVLSGFMRILTNEFVNHYLGKMINIHPALLPKFKGLNTHQRAIDAGDPEHGASVHFVTPELDDGPVIVQACVPVLSDDTAEILADRVHSVEHIIYPLAVSWLAEGRVAMRDGETWLDDHPITAEEQMVKLS